MLGVSLLALVLATAAGDPVASVWYRGTPAGTPRLDDLAEIKALGFNGVTWPLMSADGGRELRRLADVVGLSVVIRDEPGPERPEAALRTSEYLDVPVARIPANELTVRVWRAIAHGARVISFDAGVPQGTGLSDRAGQSPPWVAPAAAIARQIAFNGGLVGACRPGPAVAMESPAAAVEVSMLDAGRSWVLVATNASRDAVTAVVRLPERTPSALWLNLLDGSTMSMLNDPAGPRWTVTLDPWTARVYVIDKIPKGTGLACASKTRPPISTRRRYLPARVP